MALNAAIARIINGSLQALDFCLAMGVLGLAGWRLEKVISSGFTGPFGPPFAFSPALAFGGNAVTPWLVSYSLLAGMVTVASVITALHHIRVWTDASAAGAQAASWIAWLLLVLTFCMAWKQIRIGGVTVRSRVLEILVIILTFTKFVSTLALYLQGEKRRKQPTNI